MGIDLQTDAGEGFMGQLMYNSEHGITSLLLLGEHGVPKACFERILQAAGVTTREPRTASRTTEHLRTPDARTADLRQLTGAGHWSRRPTAACEDVGAHYPSDTGRASRLAVWVRTPV